MASLLQDETAPTEHFLGAGLLRPARFHEPYVQVRVPSGLMPEQSIDAPTAHERSVDSSFTQCSQNLKNVACSHPKQPLPQPSGGAELQNSTKGGAPNSSAGTTYGEDRVAATRRSCPTRVSSQAHRAHSSNQGERT